MNPSLRTNRQKQPVKISGKMLEIAQITVSSNSKELKTVVDAVNATIRAETLAAASQQGIESPAVPEYGIGELLKKYNYRCSRVRFKWYSHTFTIKTAPVQTR